MTEEEINVVWKPQPGPQQALIDCPLPLIGFGGARGGGKGLALTERIPTVDGWKPIAQIVVGDRIFDADGKPTTVVYKSQPTLRQCFRLTFDNGQTIIADDVHRWITYSKTERASNAKRTDAYRAKRRATRPSRAKANPFRPTTQQSTAALNRLRKYDYLQPTNGSMRSTLHLYETLNVNNGREVNHAIKIAGQVSHSSKELPIPPYVLGVWLGDGSSASGYITIGDQDSRDITRSLWQNGYKSQRYANDICYKIWRDVPFVSELKHLGLINNKHIPESYLCGSIEQRLELLQGLFDADGCCNADGQIEFCSTNYALASGVFELLASLGVKPFITSKKPLCSNAKGEPKRCQEAWIVKATTMLPVFTLHRKLRRLPQKLRETQRWHYIVNIEAVEPVWTQCLEVDSPTHTFLVSKSFIPTHNTDAVLGKFGILAETLNEKFNGVFFRRELPQADDLIERAKQIYLPLGALYNDQKKQFTFKGGARLRFRPLEGNADAEKFQGQNLCVAVGTRLRMADGSFKPIESITIGEYVSTLEGPRKVTHKIEPYLAPCVESRVLAQDGSVVGVQQNPIWHPVLTAHGVFSTAEYSEQHTSQKHHIDWLSRQWALSACSEDYKSLACEDLKRQAWFACVTNEKTYCIKSLDDNQALRQLGTLTVPVALHAQTVQLARKQKHSSHAAATESHVPDKSCEQLWVHPYTGEAMRLVEDVVFGMMEVTYVGEKLVTDITVESANHYISDCGLINKNSHAAVEEAGNYPSPEPIFKLFGALRGGNIQLILTFNPGGVGHWWLRDKFVRPSPKGWEILKWELPTGDHVEYVYIPSRVQDNKILLERDPKYIQRLHLVGSPELVRAWLEGDFEIHEGSYFPEFSSKHIIHPFNIPKHWPKYLGFDWGYRSPFAAIWGAVSSGKTDDGREVEFPRGSMVIYRELWGKQIENKEQAERIASLSIGESVHAVADPSIFSSQGGPSINDQFNTVFTKYKHPSFRAADNDRISGWTQIRRRLQGTPPMLYIFSTCPYLLESLPSLQLDPKNHEDADSTGDDHACDALRYLCKERLLDSTYEMEPQKAIERGNVKLQLFINQVRNEQKRARL